MDYNCYSGILLGDAHNKHILIILLIDWLNFRKLQKWFSAFKWHKIQNRKPNSLLIKTWNFSMMTILKPQNSALWAGSITNEIMLFYFYDVNKHEILFLSSKGSVKTKKGHIELQLKPFLLNLQTLCKVTHINTAQKQL